MSHMFLSSLRALGSIVDRVDPGAAKRLRSVNHRIQQSEMAPKWDLLKGAALNLAYGVDEAVGRPQAGKDKKFGVPYTKYGRKHRNTGVNHHDRDVVGAGRSHDFPGMKSFHTYQGFKNGPQFHPKNDRKVTVNMKSESKNKYDSLFDNPASEDMQRTMKGKEKKFGISHQSLGPKRGVGRKVVAAGRASKNKYTRIERPNKYQIRSTTITKEDATEGVIQGQEKHYKQMSRMARIYSAGVKTADRPDDRKNPHSRASDFHASAAAASTGKTKERHLAASKAHMKRSHNPVDHWTEHLGSLAEIMTRTMAGTHKKDGIAYTSKGRMKQSGRRPVTARGFHTGKVASKPGDKPWTRPDSGTVPHNWAEDAVDSRASRDQAPDEDDNLPVNFTTDPLTKGKQKSVKVAAEGISGTVQGAEDLESKSKRVRSSKGFKKIAKKRSQG